MRFNFGDICGGLALVGVCVIGYEVKKLKDKYEKAIDDIADNVNVDISNEIISEAVDRAVNREASAQVSTACARAVRSMHDDIHNQVSAAVDAEKANLKENTKKEIEKRIANIDISDAKKEVIAKAQVIVADRLEEDTKAIAGTYEASIKKVADMCENMISTATLSAQQVRQPIDVGDMKTIVQLFKEV